VRQFDVYQNPSPSTRTYAPYIVVLSSHLLWQTSVAVVAPLVRNRSTPIQELEVHLNFQDEPLVLSLVALAGIETSLLKQRVGSLGEDEDAIRRGLDRLFTGF
jgi:hypothetical protein